MMPRFYARVGERVSGGMGGRAPSHSPILPLSHSPAGRRLLLLALAALLGLAAAVWSAPATLEVLCGPAIRKPVEEALAQFQKETGIHTEISFDASNVLLGQLKIHPHGDVFIPADRFYTDQAVAEGLAESPKVIASFVPVIMVRKGNPKKVRTLADLMKPGLRVGVGDERTAAIGRTTVDLLKLNKVPMEKINVVLRAPKIDELGNAVRLGSIDATVIYDGVAANYGNEVTVVRIPEKQNILVPVAAAVIKSAKEKDAARRFIAFLVSAKGQAIFKKYHYQTAAGRK